MMARTVVVNVPVVAPALTVTLAGTVAFALSLDSATASPPVRAALLNVTVQIEDPGAFTVAGEQTKPLTTGRAARLMLAVLLTPSRLAVTVAEASTLTVSAVAENVPPLDPAATVKLAGTVNTAELLDTATVAALTVAFVSVTVQVDTCADPSVLGAQLTVDNCAGATTLSEKVCETPFEFTVTTAD